MSEVVCFLAEPGADRLGVGVLRSALAALGCELTDVGGPDLRRFVLALGSASGRSKVEHDRRRGALLAVRTLHSDARLILVGSRDPEASKLAFEQLRADAIYLPGLGAHRLFTQRDGGVLVTEDDAVFIEALGHVLRR